MNDLFEREKRAQNFERSDKNTSIVERNRDQLRGAAVTESLTVFWRAQRSSLILEASFLVTEDGTVEY